MQTTLVLYWPLLTSLANTSATVSVTIVVSLERQKVSISRRIAIVNKRRFTYVSVSVVVDSTSRGVIVVVGTTKMVVVLVVVISVVVVVVGHGLTGVEPQ